MTISSLSTLRRRWAWLSVLAIILFVTLGLVDLTIKGPSGFGILDLEAARSVTAVQAISDAWHKAQVLGPVGFLLGLDYLFMPLWGFSFFYGGMAARERFAPGPGGLRSVLGLLSWAALVGSALDALENALEYLMIVGGRVEMAPVAFMVTLTKTICFMIGVALSLAAVWGSIRKSKS